MKFWGIKKSTTICMFSMTYQRFQGNTNTKANLPVASKTDRWDLRLKWAKSPSHLASFLGQKIHFDNSVLSIYFLECIDVGWNSKKETMFKWHVIYVLAKLFQFLCECTLLLRRKLDYKFSVKHVNPFSALRMLAKKAYLCARKYYLWSVWIEGKRKGVK